VSPDLISRAVNNAHSARERCLGNCNATVIAYSVASRSISVDTENATSARRGCRLA